MPGSNHQIFKLKIEARGQNYYAPFASRCLPAIDHFNIDDRLPMLIVLCYYSPAGVLLVGELLALGVIVKSTKII